MGQQQLLLLVLGIIIVGLAVIVGITAFSENLKKSNADALVNDAVRIASDAQAWKLKPAAFGGQDDALKGEYSDFTGADWQKIGYKATEGEYINLNGTFTFDPDPGTAGITIVGTNLINCNEVTVEVTGTTPNDIETTVNLDACEAADGT